MRVPRLPLAAGRLEAAGRAVAVVAAALWLALVEVFWLPLRVAGVLVPVSIVAAVVGNLLLVALAMRVTGSRLMAALPAVAWVGVVVTAMGRRPEGDLVLPGSGPLGTVSLAFLVLGMLAAAFAVGRALGTPPPPTALRARTSPRSAPHPAGSGSDGAR